MRRRAAVYARYSSDLQSPTSIDDQFALCRAHAVRLGAEVVETFSDADAHGSSTAHRPGYRQLLAAALTTPPPFDLILVEDLSRLTRQMNETMSLYHRLRLHGVELVGVSDGIASATRGAARSRWP
jgi:DNA invertase Pin-like site-specific DNA recombinase